MATQEELLERIIQAANLLKQETLRPSMLNDIELANELLWGLLDEQDGR
jgi:hypothetical protein